jgi:hypothetical protein
MDGKKKLLNPCTLYSECLHNDDLEIEEIEDPNKFKITPHIHRIYIDSEMRAKAPQLEPKDPLNFFRKQ